MPPYRFDGAGRACGHRRADGLDVGERRELYGGFGNSLVWAFEFAATPFLFGLIGHFLDGRLGTGPWLTVFLVVFALAGLSVRMYYGYVAAMEEHEATAPWRVSLPKQSLDGELDRASAGRQSRLGSGAQGPPVGAL